jgi:hypothetical protein
MNSLAEQQQALLQALWTRPGQAQPDSPADGPEQALGDARARARVAALPPAPLAPLTPLTPLTPLAQPAPPALDRLVAAPWQRGLAAYRTNASALAERALQAAYPVVAELIGGAGFGLMARHFWQRHPPERGDLAWWGDALPGFLASDSQLVDVPYLADVARVEWALHCNASAPDAAPLEPASFAMLGQQAPGAVTLRLPPGTALQRSSWPVVSLINAHLHDESTLDTAAARVQARQGEAALVWRQGLRPRLAACSSAEAALIDALLAGQSLLAALEAVDMAPLMPGEGPFDFSAWLNAAVTQGQVLGAVI